MNENSQESKDNIQEKEERKRTKKIIAGCIGVAGVFCLVIISLFVGFTVGQKKQIPAVEAEIEAIKQEAAAKVEDVQQKADAKVEAAQKEANAKIEEFEEMALWQRDEAKYKMLEECAENQERILRGEKITFIYATLQLDGIPFPELDFEDDSLDDAKILEYIDALEELAEKYPLSLSINGDIVFCLERVEEELKANIQKVETFEVIWALKEQCEKNREKWFK